jgi:membrane protein required for colicin V production
VNWLSVVLIAAIAFMTWRAYSNGFIRELVSLSVVILAIPLAGVFYDDMYPKVHPIIDSENLASLVSFLAILGGVIVAGQVAAHLLKGVVAMLNLGAADRLAGAAFGFAKAVVVCQVLLIALVVFPKPDIQGAIDDSAVAQALLDSAPAVLTFLPGTFDTALDLFLSGAAAVDQALPGKTPTPSP